MNRALRFAAPFVIGAAAAIGMIASPVHATEGTEPSPDIASIVSSTPSVEFSDPAQDQLTEPTTSPAAPEEGIGTAIRTELWFLPSFPLDETPAADDARIWNPDQQKFDGTQYGWCQQDTYPADAPDFGPTLHQGEDAGYALEWSFVICGAPPVVTPPEPVPPAAIEPAVDTTPAPAVAIPETPRVLASTGPVTGWMFPVAAASALLGGLFLAVRRIWRRA